jgi:hypothetical protein
MKITIKFRGLPCFPFSADPASVYREGTPFGSLVHFINRCRTSKNKIIIVDSYSVRNLEVGKQAFSKSPQICQSLGSFRYRKSANSYVS